MAEKRKIIDPDGDLLVILREPSTISSWSVEADPVSLEPVGPETSDVITEPNNNEEAQPELSEAPDPEEWHFKASSKHLALASTHFKKMMDGPWREAHEIHDDGLRHWVLDDFDPDALAIVLNIIHGKSRRVPRIVQLEALVEIARIVDYVECHEAVEVYSSPWIRQLEDTVPSSYAWYTTELAYWICIAGVFYEDKIFESCTRLAILESYIDIPTLGLPILPSVGDKITERRLHHLEEILAAVHSFQDHLRQGSQCSFECDAMLLGTLTKHMHSYSLSPSPTEPHLKSLSVAGAISTVNDLSAPKWYSQAPPLSKGDGSTVKNTVEMSRGKQQYLERSAKRALKADLPHEQLRAMLEDLAELKELKVQEVQEVSINLEVVEHKCGFSELIATVNSLESEIKGLCLEDKCGVLQTDW